MYGRYYKHLFFEVTQNIPFFNLRNLVFSSNYLLFCICQICQHQTHTRMKIRTKLRTNTVGDSMLLTLAIKICSLSSAKLQWLYKYHA